MTKALIIDGNHIVHRCYHASTLARYSIHNATKFLAPDYTIVVFDHNDGTPCWRTKLYPNYKANRKRKPDDIAGIQRAMDDTKAWLHNMGVCIVSALNTEGDDVIGSLTRKISNQMRVQILTDDRDLFQLISDNVDILLPGKLHTPVDRYECLNITGYFPEQIVSYKSLKGDSSDGYKGVSGIGEVAAGKLLSEFKTSDNVYNNLDSLDPKVKSKLVRGYQEYLMCKQLSTIQTNLKLNVTRQDCATPPSMLNNLTNQNNPAPAFARVA